MKDRLERFLEDLDQSLAPHAQGDTLEVYHIGRSALVWEYGHAVTTKDIDILRPQGAEDLVALALKLFGPETAKARAHSLYLEVVDEGLPPMPGGYKQRAKRVEGPWKVLHVYHLDPHDLVASKLRRFAPGDRGDIRLLCDQGRIDPDRLEQVLDEAYRFNLAKDGDEFRDAAYRHLSVVQRYLRGEIREF